MSDHLLNGELNEKAQLLHRLHATEDALRKARRTATILRAWLVSLGLVCMSLLGYGKAMNRFERYWFERYLEKVTTRESECQKVTTRESECQKVTTRESECQWRARGLTFQLNSNGTVAGRWTRLDATWEGSPP